MPSLRKTAASSELPFGRIDALVRDGLGGVVCASTDRMGGDVVQLVRRTEGRLVAGEARALPNPARSLGASPDGRWIAAGDDYGELSVFRRAGDTLVRGRTKRVCDSDKGITQVAVGPSGDLLAVAWGAAGEPSAVEVFRVRDEGLGRSLARYEQPTIVRAVVFTDESSLLVANEHGGCAWLSVDGAALRVRRQWRRPGIAFDLARVGKFVALARGDYGSNGRTRGEVLLFSLSAPEVVRQRIALPAGWPSQTVGDPSGRLLAVVNDEPRLRVLDTAGPHAASPVTPWITIEAPARAFDRAAFGDDGRTLYASSRDGVLRLYELPVPRNKAQRPPRSRRRG